MGHKQTEDRNPKWEIQSPELSSRPGSTIAISLHLCQVVPWPNSGGDGGGGYSLPCMYTSMVFRWGMCYLQTLIRKHSCHWLVV